MALRWLSLVAAIWLQSVSGTNSNIPVYSPRLKQLLSIFQVQLNHLAFANDVGKVFDWLSGIAALYLLLWLVLLLGSSLGLVGYDVQYLFLVHKIAFLSYWQVFVLTALAGNSICWINTVSYIVAIQNFPLDRQVAVGISTSYVGLSAKIFTDMVEVSFPDTCESINPTAQVLSYKHGLQIRQNSKAKLHQNGRKWLFLLLMNYRNERIRKMGFFSSFESLSLGSLYLLSSTYSLLLLGFWKPNSLSLSICSLLSKNERRMGK